MKRRQLWGLLLLGSLGGAKVFAAKGAEEVLGEGVRLRWAEGDVLAVASSAADLRAPSGEVARVKAERLARGKAAERMLKALLALPAGRWEGVPPTEASLKGEIGAAQAEVDYASNGGVVVRLLLPLTKLPVRLKAPLGGRKEARR